METKHTPAPWFCNGNNIVYLGATDENFITCERNGVDTDICQIFAQFEFDQEIKTALPELFETEANVRLIAASPELFHELNNLINMHDGKCLNEQDWDVARHAIKRALTGEFE